MSVTQSRILKNDSITVKGTHKISHKASTPAAGAGTAANKTQPKAEIIQKEPDFAIIEVTCGCGQKVQLRCDYSSAQS
jgi:hypothetical protein